MSQNNLIRQISLIIWGKIICKTSSVLQYSKQSPGDRIEGATVTDGIRPVLVTDTKVKTRTTHHLKTFVTY